MPSNETRYANKVFMAGALPLMKIIATDDRSLSKLFRNVNAVYQVSAMADGEKEAVHFVVTNGVWETCQGVYGGSEKIDAELAFSSMEKMNAFMKGDMTKLPSIKIKNIKKFGLFMAVLLKMSSLLNMTDAPEDEETALFLCKLYFALLSTGISALNKIGHPSISEWTSKSPDRCYQWDIVDHSEVAAYLRIAEGKSKAGKGIYPRSAPFVTMKFDNAYSALLILMEKGDMFDMTANRQLIIEGGPEFGVQLGDHMVTVGRLAK
ncbi:MAG: hypothetical protein GX241_01175 [Ruminococcaceae bacterium]|nr:hypothetical protein [Oscillospiraceae bacterium]